MTYNNGQQPEVLWLCKANLILLGRTLHSCPVNMHILGVENWQVNFPSSQSVLRNSCFRVQGSFSHGNGHSVSDVCISSSAALCTTGLRCKAFWSYCIKQEGVAQFYIWSPADSPWALPEHLNLLSCGLVYNQFCPLALLTWLWKARVLKDRDRSDSVVPMLVKFKIIFSILDTRNYWGDFIPFSRN